jgi:nitroreductase
LTKGVDVELTEAMTTQRAVRRVKPDPVDDDVIRRILGLAIMVERWL